MFSLVMSQFRLYLEPSSEICLSCLILARCLWLLCNVFCMHLLFSLHFPVPKFEWFPRLPVSPATTHSVAWGFLYLITSGSRGVRACIWVCVFMRAWVYVWLYVCVFECLCTSVCVCIYVCLSMDVCLQVSIYLPRSAPWEFLLNFGILKFIELGY